MNNTTIEWTDLSWNPITGCTKYSLGCQNCYAEKRAKLLESWNNVRYQNGFRLTCHPDLLKKPLDMKKGKEIFVCSMSDIFHKDVTNSYISEIFQTMNKASQHQFYVLTKRSERIPELNSTLKWTKNIWLGVTLESADYLYRIDHLRQSDAHVKFLSMEPLLGEISNIDLSGIDWVILGGESGPGARPMKKEWVIDIRDQCLAAGVPFFFKQWGGKNKKKNGCLLQGEIWKQRPVKGFFNAPLLIV